MANSIKLLDIDLDAFQSDTAYSRSGRRRVSAKRYVPWSPDQLRQFLEVNCRLSRSQKIPGRFAIEHDVCLSYMEHLHDTTGRKINVVHLDGHADLGFGDSSWVHLSGHWLRLPIDQRRNPPISKEACNPGSYLAYGAAEGLIEEIIFAHPPGRRDDLHPIYFLNNDIHSGFLQFKQYNVYGYECYNMITEKNAISVGDKIKFKTVPIEKFHTLNNFECAFLCQSPAFTSKKSDLLITVCEEYINFDKFSTIIK